MSPLQGPAKLITVSMTDNKISGADEPSARRVRFATVAFQTFMWIVSFSPVFSFTLVTVRFLDVMTSIADMNVSEMMAMPKKQYTSARKYVTGWTG